MVKGLTVQEGGLMLRTVIADDDPLARERLRQLLRDHAEIEILAECVDGRETVDAIRAYLPDLVFLDVHMPGMDAFGVIEEIGPEDFPAIVFVTAYDRRAVRAFEARALDYLLKPIGRQRFARALERARTRVATGEGSELALQLGSLVDELRAETEYLERLLIRKGARLVMVRLDDVDWIDGAGNYIELHAGKSTYLLRHTLSGLESRLDPHSFVRIHRSTIVNATRITELQSTIAGDYVVTLRDGTRLSLSRTYRGKVQQLAGRNGARASGRAKAPSLRLVPRSDE
jgi:two-component system, LytTR family, response regulator